MFLKGLNSQPRLMCPTFMLLRTTRMVFGGTGGPDKARSRRAARCCFEANAKSGCSRRLLPLFA
jgi:hypothetical protein